MIDESREYIRVNYGQAKVDSLDERMVKLCQVGYIGQFELPSKLWSSGASVQANEYRLVMQVLPIGSKVCFRATKFRSWFISRLLLLFCMVFCLGK